VILLDEGESRRQAQLLEEEGHSIQALKNSWLKTRGLDLSPIHSQEIDSR